MGVVAAGADAGVLEPHAETEVAVVLVAVSAPADASVQPDVEVGSCSGSASALARVASVAVPLVAGSRSRPAATRAPPRPPRTPLAPPRPGPPPRPPRPPRVPLPAPAPRVGLGACAGGPRLSFLRCTSPQCSTWPFEIHQWDVEWRNVAEMEHAHETRHYIRHTKIQKRRHTFCNPCSSRFDIAVHFVQQGDQV